MAVNGPPGTGKTTLLQSIVANMYVERALKKEKAPLIVASSTNNQAVTNIIESFGKIKVIGYKNLEKRWVEGVNSFAVYFPSSTTETNADAKGYQYNNSRGEHFISDIENKENIEKSKTKILENCSQFFNTNYTTLKQCEEKLHDTLCTLNDIKGNLLNIFYKFEGFSVEDKIIEGYLEYLKGEQNNLESKVSLYNKRVEAWKKHFKEIPFIYKLLRFLKTFKRKIENRNRMFIESEEDFLNVCMSLDDIEEKYSYKVKEVKDKVAEVKGIYSGIEKLKFEYDENIAALEKLDIDIFKNEESKEIKSLDRINEIQDKTVRYIQFWLATHYYECRWARFIFK